MSSHIHIFRPVFLDRYFCGAAHSPTHSLNSFVISFLVYMHGLATRPVSCFTLPPFLSSESFWATFPPLAPQSLLNSNLIIASRPLTRCSRLATSLFPLCVQNSKILSSSLCNTKFIWCLSACLSTLLAFTNGFSALKFVVCFSSGFRASPATLASFSKTNIG